MSRMVAKMMLEKVMGFHDVTILENSANFLENVLALKTAPTVVFLDIQVRPLDGYEMLKILQAVWPFHRTLVIALTASVMEPDIARLREAGFSGLIGKPIMKDVFPQLVERVLSGEEVWYVP